MIDRPPEGFPGANPTGRVDIPLGNGPAYVYEKDVQVVGPDVYGLDADHDGLGCES